MLITLVDSNFGGRHGRGNAFFKWDQGEQDIMVFTDNHLGEAANHKNKKMKIGWLVEPISISPNIYQNIPSMKHDYDYIFSSNKQFIKRQNDKKFMYVPFGTSWILSPQIYKKTKNISTIVSEQRQTECHRMRHEIVAKYKNVIDVWGRAYKFCTKKEEALSDYRFSIVTENEITGGWFTEKIVDCFMTGTIPIYKGDPDIGNIFDINGIITFNTMEDLDKIITMCNEEEYSKKISSINKNLETAKKYALPEDVIWDWALSKIL